jgi:hypothetical protein
MLDIIEAISRRPAGTRNASRENLIEPIARGDREAMRVFHVGHKASVLRSALRSVLALDSVNGLPSPHTQAEGKPTDDQNINRRRIASRREG